MSVLDPVQLFFRIANDIPPELRRHLFVTGSLAAAYHFKTRLQQSGVNTKDADVLIHPAGDVASTASMARQLLAGRWRRHEDCYPLGADVPTDQLRIIRLHPPETAEYYLEFLGLPEVEQEEQKAWLRVTLADGDYGLPCFRYMRLMSVGRRTTESGIEYASAATMALANLLSHQELGHARIESDGEMYGFLRSAKDLGRVVALAWLTGSDAGEAWLPEWVAALNECFPVTGAAAAARAGDGLQALLVDRGALDEAYRTTQLSLLKGLGVTPESFAVTAQRLLQDAIDLLPQQIRRPA